MFSEEYNGDNKRPDGQSPMPSYPPASEQVPVPPALGNYPYQPQYQYQYSPYGYDEPYQVSPPPPYPQQQPGGQYPYPPPQPGYAPDSDLAPQGPDSDDRGILGAVAGGAAGAYAGHQVNHGILGALGGAITGSLAEDAIKHKTSEKKHEKKEKKSRIFGFHRRGSPSSSSSSSSSDSDSEDKKKKKKKKKNAAAAAPRSRGNFSASSRDITLQANYELVVSCRAIAGHQKRSKLPLNSILTNEFGHFKWRHSGNFGASARNARLTEGGRVLEAELANGRGEWRKDCVRLDERISNNDGNLVFVD
ncbi:putative glutamine-serine-proline rich protein [Aspergillus lucknowensis]|uniref:CVNH domain-containing protein n=1 Tax=Aspergillus lucknowensis TaxID=176173 RepID=A0ABR4LKJ1_9EURO